jgi:peptidoglycan hydrolase CwlO-like protein
MTAQETERLVRVEEKQTAMQEDIEELKAQAEKINKKLDNINSTLDNLMGGKKALIWITGIFLTITSLAIAIINSFKHN